MSFLSFFSVCPKQQLYTWSCHFSIWKLSMYLGDMMNSVSRKDLAKEWRVTLFCSGPWIRLGYSVKMNLKSAMNGSPRDLRQSPFREPRSPEVLEQFYQDRELGNNSPCVLRAPFRHGQWELQSVWSQKTQTIAPIACRMAERSLFQEQHSVSKSETRINSYLHVQKPRTVKQAVVSLHHSSSELRRYSFQGCCTSAPVQTFSLCLH